MAHLSQQACKSKNTVDTSAISEGTKVVNNILRVTEIHKGWILETHTVHHYFCYNKLIIPKNSEMWLIEITPET